MIDDKELILYDWRKHEALLIGMWYEALQEGTLDQSFTPIARYLTQFLSYFKDRATVGLAVDEKGVWFAMTAEMFFGGVQVGMWVRKDRRKSPAVFHMVRKAHEEIFKATDHAIAMTCVPENVGLFKRFGYKAAGALTGIWSGNDVWLFELSKDEFEHSRRKSERS